MRIWRTVRLFLSSTFRDMHAERDHLIKVTFPNLRERLLPFRVELLDIDLRWGITEKEAEDERVISLCLQQVEECRPYFLGFLGQRYGWVPDHIPEDTRAEHPWLDDHPGASVTEMEILHGALRQPGRRALFCLRDAAAHATIPEPSRTGIFGEKEDGPRTRLARLKERLHASGHPVRDYTGRWDRDAPDRPTGGTGRLVGLRDFGEQVEAWLWDAVRAELQLPDQPPAVDPRDEETDLHERFMESRLRIYVGRQEVDDQLHAFVRGDDRVPCLLLGPSGIGKSAALARFVQTLRARNVPTLDLLPHFVGASAVTSLNALLGRLIDEVQRLYGFARHLPDDLPGRIGVFRGLLGSIPEGRRLVLVLDAVNQLDTGSGAEQLHWLPEELPPHVKVVASSVTGPGLPPPVLGAFAARDCHRVEMGALTDDDRRAVIRRVPKLVAKTLDEKQVDLLLANPATANPLYLYVALEELRGYGSFETLNELIGEFAKQCPTAMELFELVFERLEQEFNRELVIQVLQLLAVSRRGLSEVELHALVALLPGHDDLMPVLRQLRPYLLSRAGRWDFYHTSIRRAVERRYLKRTSDEPGLEPSREEHEARLRLVHYFEGRPTDARRIEELPWQLTELHAWQRLYELLADLPFFYAAWQVNEFEVRAYWARIEQAEPSFAKVDAYRPALDNPAACDNFHLWELATYLRTSGHPKEAGVLGSHLIDYSHTTDERIYAACLGNQSLILMDQGDLEGALRLHKEQEEICRRLGDPTGLSTCLGNQALILRAQGDLEGAMRLLQQQEANCRSLSDLAGLQRSLGNQSLILKAQGDLEGALRLLKQQEEICRRLSDPAGLSAGLGNQAELLRAKGDFESAMRLNKEVEAICRRLGDPAGLSACLGNQALILKAQGDLEGAMRLLKQQEEICRRLGDPAGLSACLGNQALILKARGDLGGAMRLHKQQEEICRRLGDPAGLSASLGNQALILMDQGDLEGALRLLQEQKEICRRLGDPAGLGSSLGNQALILMAQGDLGGAMRLHKQQEEICRRLGDPAGLSKALCGQGLVLQAQGELEEALNLYRQEEEICRRLGDPAGLGRSLGNQALVLQAQGDLEGALHRLQQVEEICRLLGAPKDLAIALVNQARLWAFDRNQPREAWPLVEEEYALALRHGLRALAEQIRPIHEKIRQMLGQ